MTLVSDFDFHPSEPHVRRFQVPQRDVLRCDDEAYVSDARFGDVTLRHFAFRDEWFKVNVTLDEAGQVVETGLPGFAFNCDVATQMARRGDSIYAVDLFADVLVAADGISHQVKDLPELQEAVTLGLVSKNEFDGARRGLDRLLGLVSDGDLMSYLDAVCPFGRSLAGPALPMDRVPLADVPELQPRRRPTW
ncbi:hypothetical protein [Paractinoplanes atraurantiacus]|uniref:DUF402 domain-containing protein n=1 Tax=Paractinoplanes atraurantiacus TaxID=1036182 RepID=A0A285GXW5_9ACTN|nr:hypothetical protein [Actinoplanes atraurantiacus]SNY28337.1 hypothetical protein SAMN05421748_10365 [Actinoplanes atraurantiacus]